METQTESENIEVRESKWKVKERWSEENGHQIIITLDEETLPLPGLLILDCKTAFRLAEAILNYSCCGSTSED
jgi:hypothetical protein